MNKIQYPPLYVGLYILLIVSISSVMTVQLDGPASLGGIIFWCLTYGAGLYCGWQFNQHDNQSFKTVTDIVTAMTMMLFIVSIFSAGFDTAFLLLLIGVQAARNFILTTRKDFYYSYVISLILILYASSRSTNTLFLLYVIIYVLAGMHTLLADHIDEILSRARGGDRAVLLGKMSLPVKGAGLSVAVVAVSIILYLLVPRPPSPRLQAFPSGGGWNYDNAEWERQAQKSNNHNFEEINNPDPINNESSDPTDSGQVKYYEYGGFGERFDIQQAQAKLPNDIVFYLQADRQLYVRAKVFDKFDGRAWMVSKSRGRKVRNDNQFSLDRQFSGMGIGQTFTVNTEMPPYILGAYRPVTVWFPGGAIHQESNYSLLSPLPLKKGTIYSVMSDYREQNGRPYSSGETISDMGIYLQLPDDLSERVSELGKEITKDAQGSLKKAEAIERYLRTNYLYTMNTVFKHPDSSIIDQFLFDTKAGHCEYFATSMVLFLRLADIPARLATGYAVDRENPITGYYEVRRMNAHAWVEAYISGYGWMTFEPTSQFMLSHESKPVLAATGIFKYIEERLSSVVRENPRTWWASLIKKVLEFLKWLWQALRQFIEFLLSTCNSFIKWFLTWGWMSLFMVLIVTGTVFILYRPAERVLERIVLDRLRQKDYRQCILRIYKNMGKTVSRKNMHRRSSCTPSEFAPICSSRLPHISAPIETITKLFNLARYSNYSFSSSEADMAFEAYIAIVKHVNKIPKGKL